MPIRQGYSHDTFTANIAEMVRAGHSNESAIWTAAAAARRAFFRTYPQGALPLWLAWPKQFRTRRYYTEHGEPVATHPDNVRENPTDSEIAQARSLYAGFTGVQPRTVRNLKMPPAPKAALAIGRVFGIMYTVDATGERLHHEFKGSARPLLVVSADGHQVFLRGGAFTFTKRGFIDRTD